LYQAHQGQVDRIISRLALTQFAAGWIVTLQRAAELGLNRGHAGSEECVLSANSNEKFSCAA
jgi:hypothetical protein